jgi:putative transposase
MYSLYLYFLGLSLRNTSKALEPFKDEKRSYVSVWNWIQRFGSCQIYNKRKRVSAFIIDETIIQIGSQRFCWLWICIEPVHKSVLGIHILQARNMLILSSFLESLVEKYGRHIVYSDGGGTWYDEACKVIGLKHYLHSPLEKSLIERVVQYFKDRTECFDDYYPCNSKRRDCNNSHVYNWIELFVSMYNNTRVTKNNPLLQIIKEVLIP